MTLFALSQVLVGIALCTDIISFQFKERAKIISCLLVSCTLISLHFVCLGHWTAACLGVLAATRFVVSLYTTSRAAMMCFLIAAAVSCLLTYDGLLSILGCSGSMFGTVASFSKSDKTLRQLMLVGTALWLLHNILAGSPGAVVMEIVFMGSNLVGYFRYYIRPARQVLG